MFKNRFNLLFKIALFVIPLISITFLSSDTYATRLEVDVDNLTDYFSQRHYATPVVPYSGYFTFTSVIRNPFVSFLQYDNLNCDDDASYYYAYVEYGDGWSEFDVSGWTNYVSGDFPNIIFRNPTTVSDSYPYPIFTFAFYTDSYFSAGDYYFDSIVIGCSEEEVAESTATPTPTATATATPTPTATATATPTATADEINPDDYEYNSVEDSIVKYRFISFIVIVVAGLLLYHVIIKRIILK